MHNLKKIFILATLEIVIVLFSCQGCSSAKYEVEHIVGYVNEFRFMSNEHQFMTLINSDGIHDGTLILRPHPGNDKDGWGSSWYAQPFLQGADIQYAKVDSIAPTDNGIRLKASGLISDKGSLNYGTWDLLMNFSYDPKQKLVNGSGIYSVRLIGQLNNSTGDLNLYKMATNYLHEVPLSTSPSLIGETGDMSKVIVNAGLTWDLIGDPEYYPINTFDNLSVAVIGQYNNVNVTALNPTWKSINATHKPSVNVTLQNLGPKGLEMTFGAAYDISKSKDPWADNIGITPLILKQSKRTNFTFGVKFESRAIPGDD
jgi:hypothetical protein